MLSKKFIAAIKLNSIPAYKIAQLAGLHHSTLSKLMNGIEQVKPEDPRIINLGKVLGVPPDECFEDER